jgi:pimeloyl-ACP methyl ester carboxylesterase
MPALHALLTAINRYHPESKVPPLNGCHNDIRRWQQFLETRFPKENLHIRTLLNEEATYQNVVDHFGEQFLGKAVKGDTVLFVYSGHGSREKAAREFDPYYPEGMQETLVLYDSRTSGGLDLADKELAVLIERLALKDLHVVVVMDCCHAGSGTRAMEDFTLGATRQHTNRSERRPLESYLNGAFLNRNDGKGFYLPASRHILLAASDRTEKAWELTTRQGLFSTCLLQILEASGGQLSYADLYTRCRLAMAKVTDKQHPQFEPYGFFNAYEGFLGLGGASQGAPLRVFFENNTWQASMGAVHGLPMTSDHPAQFEVLKNGQVLGLINARVVGMESSTLGQPDFHLKPTETYEARLRSLPSPKALYELQGPEALVVEAKQALEAFKAVYFELQQNAPHAAYYLTLEREKIQLFRRADDALLRTLEGNDREAMFQDVFEKMELIARWEAMVALENRGARINRNDVELVLVEMDQQGNVLRSTSQNEVMVDILRRGEEEQRVPFRLEIRNKNGSKMRHCALFYAPSDYSFSPLGFNEPVPGGSTMIAFDRNPKGVQYAFELKGKPEGTDIFKLFVSNTKLSGEALKQNGFTLGETDSFWQAKGVTRGGVQLSKPKDIFGQDDDDEVEDINDWYTITLRVKCVARQASVGDSEVSLADKFIKILGHPFLRAGLSLGTASGGSRSIEPLSVVAELAQNSGVELLTFADATRDKTRDAAAPPNILELSDLEHTDGVDETHPLQIQIAANLQKSDQMEETLLAMTFDGEHLLPVGETIRQENGDALISISHLPETHDTQRKSLGKALKLCFLKLVLKKENVQYLNWVDYSGISPERRAEGLKQRVEKAQNILLLLHGIIGDTKGMCDFAGSVVKTEQEQDRPFDLVLSFDYENLHTPIEVTAGKLEELLREEAGISAASGKKITIVAHSMGGLVSRYYIQNLGGAQVVRHLIMAGTPNAGSVLGRIATYRDYAIPVLTLLVNMPWGIPAAATVLGALQKSKDLTVTLAQMDWDHSDWLKNLQKGSMHGVPCTIIAGHLELFLQRNEVHQKLMDKVYKLGGKLLYGDQPNDLAVSVESIQSVAGAANVFVVACHHMNYFEEGESVEVLEEMLAKVY